MFSGIKRLLKKQLSARGLLVEKKTPLNDELLLLTTLMQKGSIKTVLDIGANTGQFAAGLLQAGFSGNIISFEPLPDMFAILSKQAAGNSKWQTENIAIGHYDGDIEINIAGNKESSSILPMLDNHLQHAPESRYEGRIQVPIATLDTYSTGRPMQQNIFLKIDVQGYEKSVLDGAAAFIGRVSMLQLEVSFTPLYGGAAPYYDMMRLLEENGFTFYSMFPAFSNYKTGQLFQADAVYIREDKFST